jgi:hypothetical protein
MAINKSNSSTTKQRKGKRICQDPCGEKRADVDRVVDKKRLIKKWRAKEVESRVTRLGAFSSIGQLFSMGRFLNITEVAYVYFWTMYFLQTVIDMNLF